MTTATLPSAVHVPEQGASYNPAYEAHQDLLQTAHDREVKRAQDIEKVEEVRRRMEAAWENAEDGMRVDMDDEYEDEDEQEADVLGPVRPPQRKTAQQRRKAARALAEVSLSRGILISPQ